MKGGDVLCYVRDALLKVAADKRSFLEQSAAIGGVPLKDEELAEVNALGAAADLVQYAVTAGQAAKGKERPPPGWVMGMAAQARVALSSPEGENQG
jgi:hypothetical protein